MPFSSDDDTIDFIYRVISWKEIASRDLTDELVLEVGQALRSAAKTTDTTPIWADGPSAQITAALALSHQDPDEMDRSEEHTSELQSLMRISYAVFCLKKKKTYFISIRLSL